MNEILGLVIKMSKQQFPATEHRIQGTQLCVNQSTITVSPTPERRQKLIDTMQHALTTNSLTPDQAATLAGKLQFLSTTTFGKIGRAATKPIYARQHG